MSRSASGATSHSGPYTVNMRRACRNALCSPCLMTVKRSPTSEPRVARDLRFADGADAEPDRRVDSDRRRRRPRRCRAPRGGRAGEPPTARRRAARRTAPLRAPPRPSASVTASRQRCAPHREVRSPPSCKHTVAMSGLRPWRSITIRNGGETLISSASAAATRRSPPSRRISRYANAAAPAAASSASAVNEKVWPNGSQLTSSGSPSRKPNGNVCTPKGWRAMSS